MVASAGLATPPVTSTLPFGKRVAVWFCRGTPSDVAYDQVLATGRRAVPDDAVTVARFLAAEGAVPEAAGITASGAEGDVA